MPHTVDLTTVATERLKASPYAQDLAGEIRGSCFVITGEHPVPE